MQWNSAQKWDNKYFIIGQVVFNKGSTMESANMTFLFIKQRPTSEQHASWEASIRNQGCMTVNLSTIQGCQSACSANGSAPYTMDAPNFP